MIRFPPSMKTFSCGDPPDGKVPSSLPSETRSTCTRFAVEALTTTFLPFGEIAMWSDALAGDREPPHQLAGLEADRDHVGVRRPRRDQQPPVVGGVHVVDELVVALTDRLPDREVVGQPLGVGGDLHHPRVLVGDHVDPAQPPERPGREQVDGALPVVADEHHAAHVALRCLPLGGARRRDRAEHGQAEARTATTSARTRARTGMRSPPRWAATPLQRGAAARPGYGTGDTPGAVSR